MIIIILILQAKLHSTPTPNAIFTVGEMKERYPEVSLFDYAIFSNLSIKARDWSFDYLERTTALFDGFLLLYI